MAQYDLVFLQKPVIGKKARSSVCSEHIPDPGAAAFRVLNNMSKIHLAGQSELYRGVCEL
jgi:hypothetical protein